jgi:hypothetical protein
MPHLCKVSQRRSLWDQSCSIFWSMSSTDSEPRRPPIPVPRKNWTPCAGTAGRHASEWVDGIHRNRWSAWPGLCKLTPQQSEDIFELIGERHRNLSTMIASNRAPQDWYPLFPNPVIAEAALDRLINRSHHLVLEGRSYRPLLRPDRVLSLAKENEPE